MEQPSPVAISWSGGKDSCLALLRARESGRAVTSFVTMCAAGGASVAHALSADLVAAQVQALGGVSRRVEAGEGGYAAAFSQTLAELHASGHREMVFGDIDLEAHREWIAAACARAAITPLFPLWGEPRAAIAAEVIRRGIRARLVCVRADRLDADFCGAEYDAALLARLPAGVCPCGEDGEFHTFVYYAPGMATALRVHAGERRVVARRSALSSGPLVLEELHLADRLV